MKQAHLNLELFEILEKDHQVVSDLFDEIEDSLESAPESIKPLYERVKKALKAHSKGEEEAFYPLLRNDGDTRDLAEEATQEHREVDTVLAELDGLSFGDEAWVDTFEELKGAVEHHVEEEEREIFPAARKALSEDQLCEATDKFLEVKSRVLKEQAAA